MVNPNAKTCIDTLNDITNELIKHYLEPPKSTLINTQDFRLRRIYQRIIEVENKVSSFHSDGYIAFYSTLGLYYSAIGKTEKAKNFYSRAMNLKPDDLADLANYNATLLKNGDFAEVEKNIRENFRGPITDISSLSTLYQIGVRNLDFSWFLENYLPIRHKDILSEESKHRMERLYQSTKNFDNFSKDLEQIGISEEKFADFYALLNKFYYSRFQGYLNTKFWIENDDEQYLVVDIYANITIDEASKLSSEFDNMLVNYSLEKGDKSFLSQFLVYYKPYELLEDDETIGDAYLGMDDGVEA